MLKKDGIFRSERGARQLLSISWSQFLFFEPHTESRPNIQEKVVYEGIYAPNHRQITALSCAEVNQNKVMLAPPTEV